MQNVGPESLGDKFGQNNSSQLAIVGLCVVAVKEIDKRSNDGTIGGRFDF